jgi:hypothetical protein
LDAGEDLNTHINTVNTEIKKIAVWFRAYKLAVNIDKTKYIIFRMMGKKIDKNTPDIIYKGNKPGQQYDYTFVTLLKRYHDEHTSPKCKAYKYLGIYLDEHLTLESHTTHIINKLTCSLYCTKQAGI